MIVRLRLQSCALERDEGEYAYAGQLLLQGIPPYELVYNMKFPGVYLAYGLVMALLGHGIESIHVGVLLANALTIALVYTVARHWYDEVPAGAAALCYSLLSTSQATLGLAGHATHFVVLFALAGTLVLVRQRPSAIWLFVSGVLMGISVLMKQNGGLFAVSGAIYILAGAWTEDRKRRVAAARLVPYVAGAALPVAATCVWLSAVGVFDRFWFWTVNYGLRYASNVPLSDAWSTFSAGLTAVTHNALPFWILAGAGLVSAFVRRTRKDRLGFLVGFLITSFLAVCPGLYFRQHYFILLLPALSFLSAEAIDALPALLSRRHSRVAAFASLATLLVVVVADVAPRQRLLFRESPDAVVRATYLDNPFIESIRIGEYLRTNSTPETRILVMGSEPQIYYYANRQSATGYVYAYPLMEDHPYALRMQEELISDAEETKPGYMVYVTNSTSWLRQDGSNQRVFEWFFEYAQKNYVTVGRVEMRPSGESVYSWAGQPGETAMTAGENLVYVFRRKET